MLIVVGLGVAKIGWRFRKGALEGRRWESMLKEHRAVEGWPVTLTIFQGAAVAEYDLGTAWFEDGRLYFIGARTSFGLVAAQVEARRRPGHYEDGRDPVFVLRVPSTVGEVAIRLTPRSTIIPGSAAVRDAHTFERAVREWREEGIAGEGQLPPLTLGPDAPTPQALLTWAIMATSFWSLLIGALTVLGCGVVSIGGWSGLATVALPVWLSEP